MRTLAGSIINVRGRPIFTSNKSIIIQVVIVCEIASGVSEFFFFCFYFLIILFIFQTDKSSFCACSAFFTYVSLDKNGKTLEIPPLKVTLIFYINSFNLTSFNDLYQ